MLLEAGGFRVEADGTVNVTGDGRAAEVYGLPIAGRPFAGLMFSRVSGTAFDLIVDVARRPTWSSCGRLSGVHRVRAPAPRLPEDIAGHGVELVETGEELVSVIRGALPSSG